jgi:hypothetical protein
MSSYLTFYGIPKDKQKYDKMGNVESVIEMPKVPLSIFSFSRSSDLYQAFYENIHIAYLGDNDPEKSYTELTTGLVETVISGIKDDIEKASKRLNEYEKHVSDNAELIEDIISMKEYIDDLKDTLHRTYMIYSLVEDTTYSCSGFEKILCNID